MSLSPRVAVPVAAVCVVSLNGNEYSTGGLKFMYYRHPTIAAVSPTRGSANTPQVVTLTRSSATLVAMPTIDT